MSWVSPWRSPGGLTALVVNAVASADSVRKTLEAQVDAAMGVDSASDATAAYAPVSDTAGPLPPSSPQVVAAECSPVLEDADLDASRVAATRIEHEHVDAAVREQRETRGQDRMAHLSAHADIATPLVGHVPQDDGPVANAACDSEGTLTRDDTIPTGAANQPEPREANALVASITTISAAVDTRHASAQSELLGQTSTGASAHSIVTAQPRAGALQRSRRSESVGRHGSADVADQAEPAELPAASGSSALESRPSLLPVVAPAAAAVPMMIAPRQAQSQHGAVAGDDGAFTALRAAVEAGRHRELALRIQLDRAKAEAAASTVTAATLTATLRSREAQLEAASAQTASALNEAAELRSTVAAAEARARDAVVALEAEKRRVASSRADAAAAGKAAERVAELELAVKERDTRIADILAEGEALSRKMGTLEVSLKAIREKMRGIEGERDDAREELADAEARIATLDERVRSLEEEVSLNKRDRDSASGVASASERRLAAAEEEAARLRSEAKALRSSLAMAQRESEERAALVAAALSDVEAAERAQSEAEAALSAARYAETAAARAASAYEEQLRDARAQAAAVAAGAGAREDELLRELEDMTTRWQRAVATSEESGAIALAQAYGLTISTTASAADNVDGGGDTGDIGSAQRGSAMPAHQLRVGGAMSSPESRNAGNASGVTPLTQALVAQLASLQGELLAKRDAWAAARTALQARVAAAEAGAQSADDDARRAQAAAAELQSTNESLRAELTTLRAAKVRAEAEAAAAISRLHAADTRLASLTAAHDAAVRNAAEATAALAEARLRADDAAGGRAAATHMVSLLKDQLAASAEETAALRREVAMLSRDAVAQQRSATVKPAPFGNAEVASVASDAHGSQQLQFALSHSGAAAPASATSAMAAVSVAALERERDVLTDQVVLLTTRLAGTADLAARLAAAESERNALASRVELLLEMLGERDEEAEELREEINDVKEVFRTQVDTLCATTTAAAVTTSSPIQAGTLAQAGSSKTGFTS